MKNLAVVLSLLTLLSCATVGTVPGGEKDTQPPKVLSSKPDSAELNYRGNQVTIVFDEYFTVQNFSKEILISPPLTTSPSYKIKKKTLIIELNETLKSNTTYQINMGNAIRDNNEGNILTNYSLIFATGASLDSGYLSGKITSSANGEPIKNMKVQLYKPGYDTFITAAKPYYITLSDEDGHFHFKHIGIEDYEILAFTDENFNGQIDEKELIAFETQNVKANTNISLTAFPYYNSQIPFVLSSTQNNTHEIKLTWNKEIRLPSNNLNVTSIPEFYTFNKEGFLPKKLSDDKKEIHVFLPENHSSYDSIQILIFLNEIPLDTIVYFPKENLSKPTITLEVLKPSYFINAPIILKSNLPLLKSTSENITLFDQTDSIAIPITNILFPDPFTMNIEAKTKVGQSYRIFTDSMSVQSYPELRTKIDTLRFRTFNSDEWGSIEIAVSIDSSISKSSPLFVCIKSESDITNKNDKPLRTIRIDNDTILTFKPLLPGKYLVYAFSDVNENGIHDEGNLENNRLPEPKYFLKSPLEVRGNWESKNISFKIK